MRDLRFILLLSLPLPALAQDPNLTNQQIQQNIMIQQNQIMQQNQIVQQTQQNIQQNQQTAQDLALQSCDQCQRASAPKPSTPPGIYRAPVTVRLTSHTRHAHIFYTTDGWTPTTQSTPYTGPITVAATQTLRAIAVAPGSARSAIADLTYTLPSSAAAPVPALTSHFLPAGTPLRLRFTTPVDSATAYVGQPFQLALVDDLTAAGQVIAPAGTPAQAIITEVDPAHRISQPGAVTFAVKSIQIDGKDVPLSGVRTLEAKDHLGREALFLIPVVGAASALKHGDTARIPVGAELVAQVAADSTP